MAHDNDIRHIFAMAGIALSRLSFIWSSTVLPELIAVDGEDHHVDLLRQYPPQLSVSTLVNSLKRVSSRLLQKERLDLGRRYLEGCAVVAAIVFRRLLRWRTLRIVSQYIEEQKTPG